MWQCSCGAENLSEDAACQVCRQPKDESARVLRPGGTPTGIVDKTRRRRASGKRPKVLAPSGGAPVSSPATPVRKLDPAPPPKPPSPEAAPRLSVPGRAVLAGLAVYVLAAILIQALSSLDKTAGPPSTSTHNQGYPNPVASRPSDLAARSFTANWSGVSGSSGYRLDVATDSFFISYVEGYRDRDVGSALSHTITGLDPGKKYHYRVRASHRNGRSGPSSVVSVSTLHLPPAPATIGASRVSSTSFVAKWSSSAGASGYRLDVSTDPGFVFYSRFALGYHNRDVGTSVSHTVTGLRPGATYYFRVRGYSEAGMGASSGVNSVTTARDDGSFTFTVCNRSDNSAAVAMSSRESPDSSVWITEGWATVLPGRCEELGPYVRGFFYAFARESNGPVKWTGTGNHLCVEYPGPFKIRGGEGPCTTKEEFTRFLVQEGAHTWTLWPGKSPAVDLRRLITLDGYDLPGNDIARFENATYERCQSACKANPNCKALTFNRNYGVCFIKSGASRPEANGVAQSAYDPTLRPLPAGNGAIAPSRPEEKPLRPRPPQGKAKQWWDWRTHR